MEGTRHARAVRESVRITRTQWRMMKKMAATRIVLAHVLRTLNDKKIPYVLTGAHAIGGWTGRPRATRDIDLLVRAGRNHARAVKAIRGLYPHLEPHALPGVTAFFLPGEAESVIDIVVPHRADLQETLAAPVWVDDRGLKYRIPSLEAALANKYGAMLTPSRDPGKRLQDAADFTNMVRHAQEAGATPIDRDRLRDLGEKVWPSGGGREILSLVELVVQGGILDLNALHGLG